MPRAGTGEKPRDAQTIAATGIEVLDNILTRGLARGQRHRRAGAAVQEGSIEPLPETERRR
jgi:hypothetical protein